MLNGVAGWPVVVPLETIAQVIRDSDVVSCRIRLTSKDVNDPLFDAVHGRQKSPGTDRATTKIRAIR